MDPFTYVRASDEARAIEAAGKGGSILAGGTTLIDLMRLGVERPSGLVDVSRLPLSLVEATEEGLSIGAMARNSDVAWHPLVKDGFPVLAEALLSGASPQIRNMASVGGNLLQRTRCSYFRDVTVEACNKRKSGSGCAAIDGWNRMHAVLGTSDQCIATNPSDMSVALVALDATAKIRGPKGTRTVPISDFHTVPGAHPEVESVLAPGELVTHVIVPRTPFAKRSRYVKARDRASFAFALASCAVALAIEGDTIKHARVALGGVATKPWRSKEAELALVGQPARLETYKAAGEAALRDAKPRRDNAFKVELGRRVVVRALSLAGGPS